LGVPVNGILQDVRSTNVEMDSITNSFTRKKDIHNIKRDFNISYSTKKHQNDAINVDLWVKEIMKKTLRGQFYIISNKETMIIMFHASLKMILVL